jgi:hypothetical protein
MGAAGGESIHLLMAMAGYTERKRPTSLQASHSVLAFPYFSSLASLIIDSTVIDPKSGDLSKLSKPWLVRPVEIATLIHLFSSSGLMLSE